MQDVPRRRWRTERGLTGGIDEIPVAHATGRLWLCGKHFIAPDHLGAIARVGATKVVCLNEQHELVDRYPDYVAWLRGGDGRVHWVPITDLGAPPVDVAEALVAAIRAELVAGGTVIVHCGAGIGRAGTTAAAVLVDAGLDPEQAIEIVAAHRPMAGPEAGAQRSLLDELHRRRVDSPGPG